jgi:hypothetical protein
VIFCPSYSQWFGPVMVSFHHKCSDNLFGKVVVFYILYNVLEKLTRMLHLWGEIHFDVANLLIVHRDIPIMLPRRRRWAHSKKTTVSPNMC